MIDLERESLVTFAAAPRVLPAIDAVPGMEARKPLHERTIRNWATRGKCGVFLETVSMGGVLVTSREAIARFFQRLAEAMQHTENRKPFEISLAFSGLVGQYLHRVYRLMATELFGVTASDAAAPDFALTDAQLAAYDPGKWFTATEMIDTVPRVDMVPTEDDLQVLTDGIPASKLVGLQKYPSGIVVPTGYDPSTGPVSGTGTTSTAASESFAPPPGP